MDCRGFESAEAMNAYMTARWNENVSKKDEVYILGDLALAKGEEVNEILKNLNGTLYLLIGNHDARFLNDRVFDASRFEWIRPYAEIHDNQRKVILCHYPVFCYNGQNRLTDAGNPRTYMLYGHVHNSQDELLINEFIRITRNTVRAKPHVLETPDDAADTVAAVHTADAAGAVCAADAAGAVRAEGAAERDGGGWPGEEALTAENAAQAPSWQNRGPIPCNMINCFCMFSDYVPLSLDEWIQTDERRRAMLAAESS